jgi:hypothetical protein
MMAVALQPIQRRPARHWTVATRLRRERTEPDAHFADKENCFLAATAEGRDLAGLAGGIPGSR